MAKWQSDMMTFQIYDFCSRRLPVEKKGETIGMALGEFTIFIAKTAISLAAIKYLFWG